MATDDPDEPRVKDMDPATIAQLAAWFDLPSFAALEEGSVAPAAPPAPPSEAEQVKARRREVLAQIDPALVDRLERHRDRSDRLRKAHPPDRPWSEGRRITVFDDSAVPPPFDPYDAPEVEIPGALRNDLKICTPQAFLRDLHRPEKEFWMQLRSPWDDEEEPASADPMAPIRAAIAARYAPPPVTPATVSIAASTADLKGLLARPWQDSKRGPARAREEELLRKMAGAGPVSREPEEAS
jgi:hypothetical protein